MIGKKISTARKAKGLTQEELADKANINVRTLQRIENGNNIPRGKTLSLICDVLELEKAAFASQDENKLSVPFAKKVIDIFWLIGMNFGIMAVFGYLTLDNRANLNSRVGALLLSFLLPFFIIQRTNQLSNPERFLKFGSGMLLYAITVSIMHKFPLNLIIGFYPVILCYLGVLYFTNSSEK